MAGANEVHQTIMDMTKVKLIENCYLYLIDVWNIKSTLQADPDSEKQQKSSELQGKQSETVKNPIKLAKAEELRLKGNDSYGRNSLHEAVKFYTLSIRECASSTCLSNRAQANISLGRHLHKYYKSPITRQKNQNYFYESERIRNIQRSFMDNIIISILY
jgi:hypothetical protein